MVDNLVALEVVEVLMEDCIQNRDAIENGDFDALWDTHDFDNWDSMVTHLEYIKNYIKENVV